MSPEACGVTESQQGRRGGNRPASGDPKAWTEALGPVLFSRSLQQLLQWVPPSASSCFPCSYPGSSPGDWVPSGSTWRLRACPWAVWQVERQCRQSPVFCTILSLAPVLELLRSQQPAPGSPRAHVVLPPSGRGAEPPACRSCFLNKIALCFRLLFFTLSLQ